MLVDTRSSSLTMPSFLVLPPPQAACRAHLRVARHLRRPAEQPRPQRVHPGGACSTLSYVAADLRGLDRRGLPTPLPTPARLSSVCPGLPIASKVADCHACLPRVPW